MLPGSDGAYGRMCTLNLYFSARELAKMDYLSKSDPVVQVYVSDGNNNQKFVGQTEIIDDNHNPDFSTCVAVDYFFAEEQKVHCKVLDADDDRIRLSDADHIGSTYFTIASLVSAPGQTVRQKLSRPQKSGAFGMLIVTCEEQNASNQLIEMDFSVPRDLPTGGRWYHLGFHTPSPTILIWQKQENGKMIKVFQSEVQHKTKSPKWKRIKIKAQKLCNGDLNRPLKLQIADFSRGSENPEILAEADTSVNALEQLDGTSLPLYGKDGKRVQAKLQSAVIVTEQPTFMDYIRGGLQLNLYVAIDFTASNGHPTDPSSLHYMNPSKPNQYQQVIQAVGSILSAYDSDQMYPVVGFGGKVNGQVSHCFSLDPNGNEVPGIHGILQVYSNAIQTVPLSGPTLFAPLLQQLNSSVMQSQHEHAHNIQLILTDGAIHDMDNTIREIVHSSNLPISIIIVGIGKADFSNMDRLDADDEPLRTTDGQVQKIDNVQFVAYNQLGGSASRLAKEVLAELPDQVVGYHMMKQIRPRAPRAAAPIPSLQHASTGLSPDAMFQRSATNAFITASAPPPAQVPTTIPEAIMVTYGQDGAVSQGQWNATPWNATGMPPTSL